MCVSFLFQFAPESPYLLAIASNRDEFFDRPALSAAHWPQTPAPSARIFGGRDIAGGGTWLGISWPNWYSSNNNRTSATPFRLGLLTNFRERTPKRESPPPSRGNLTMDFLRKDDTVERCENSGAFAHAKAAVCDSNKYNGFNMILADATDVAMVSNRPEPHAQILAPQMVHGMSNSVINDPTWKKIDIGRKIFNQVLTGTLLRNQPVTTPVDAALLNHDLESKQGAAALRAALLASAAASDSEKADRLANTRAITEASFFAKAHTLLADPLSTYELHMDLPGILSFGVELGCAGVFVPEFKFPSGRRYGTRTSTVVLVRRDMTVTVVERNFDVPTETWEKNVHNFSMQRNPLKADVPQVIARDVAIAAST
jgi:uncharacterized protein with NRDE domain